MGIFKLKYRDTQFDLNVIVHDPAPPGSAPGTLGPVHDLTGSTTHSLHLWMSDGTKLIRTLTVQGSPTLGALRYVWVVGDWGVGAGGPPFTTGGLIVSPTLPLLPGQVEHRMEYEIVGGNSRLTFPNNGYDILRITEDIN